jgi:hypothetical protein
VGALKKSKYQADLEKNTRAFIKGVYDSGRRTFTKAEIMEDIGPRKGDKTAYWNGIYRFLNQMRDNAFNTFDDYVINSPEVDEDEIWDTFLNELNRAECYPVYFEKIEGAYVPTRYQKYIEVKARRLVALRTETTRIIEREMLMRQKLPRYDRQLALPQTTIDMWTGSIRLLEAPDEPQEVQQCQ